MNKCIDSDVQEMLPDLLHRTLPADVRGRVEAHVATCDECREELRVLRAVHSAAVFAPEIDVDRVVRQIPPYQRIVPATELPARTQPRLVSWLVAATLAITVVGVGSMLVTKPEAAVAPTVVAVATRAPALALGADVDGLSDGNLVQLMNDMNRFDALPATELDPVIPVDTGDNIEQELR
jgi:anti-sigma factor RsiW